MTDSNKDKLAFLNETAAAETPAAQAEAPAAASPQPETPPAPSAQEAAPAGQQPPIVQPTPGQAQTEQQKGEHSVPLAKYLDTFHRARDLEKEKADLQAQLQRFQQPPAQPPDPLIDSKAYGEYIEKQVWQKAQNEITQNRLNMSESMARYVHGDAIVSEAQQAFESAATKSPWLAQRVVNSQHPWNEMVAWHKEQKLLGEIGDPGKLNEWILAKAAALTPPAQPAGAGAGNPPVVAPAAANIPPPVVVAPPTSLSRAPAASRPPTEVAVGPGQAFSKVFG